MATHTLSTDYLVVGAGAMGMSFVEELVYNNPRVEVIIIDNRAAPGGHWNDAYSFVRLHQPALTYGVNSRTLGAGGPDLASKAQILQHYELAMKDLVNTNRVKFFPQCQYLGDGRFVSLLDNSMEYKVEIKSKLVDATCTTTKVPATTKPNYEVSDEVNLIPINGLSSISAPWPHYMVIGGGKTGIDAVLFLLDNNVNPDKISWVIPNDSWFFERNFMLLDGKMAEPITKMFDSIIDENVQTVTEALLALEKIGHLMRLDKDILPTRFRAATITEEEAGKLRLVKNIIRKGRIEKILAKKIVFKSGEETDTEPGTLYVDCSVNSTVFAPPKKVFDGKTINIQFIRAPPPGISANIIAALELKFPDDEEKKNSICFVLTPPQMPEDYFKMFQVDALTSQAAIKALGFRWEKQRRSSALHHIKFLELVKMMFAIKKRQQPYRNKVKQLLGEKVEN